jgi:hypothetical protein
LKGCGSCSDIICVSILLETWQLTRWIWMILKDFSFIRKISWYPTVFVSQNIVSKISLKSHLKIDTGGFNITKPDVQLLDCQNNLILFYWIVTKHRKIPHLTKTPSKCKFYNSPIKFQHQNWKHSKSRHQKEINFSSKYGNWNYLRFRDLL